MTSEVVQLVDCCHGCVCDSLGARRGSPQRYLYNGIYLCAWSTVPCVLMSWTIFGIVVPFACWVMTCYDIYMYFKTTNLEDDQKAPVSQDTYQLAVYIQLVFSIIQCILSLLLFILFIGLFIASFFFTFISVFIFFFLFSLIFVPICCFCGMIPISLQTYGSLLDWKEGGTKLDWKRYSSVKVAASMMCGITCSVYISFLIMLAIGGVGFAIYVAGGGGGGLGGFLGL